MLILLKRAEQQGIKNLQALDVTLQNWRRRQQNTL